MLALRLLNDNDLPLVESWLNKAHIKRWYDIPGVCSIDDWIAEIKERHDEFQFLTHLIALDKGHPIGFCQYYKCVDSDEDWGMLPLEGAYCIDYLIGEQSYLGKGFGKGIITQLVAEILSKPDTLCVVADIDPENIASEKALLASGFVLFDVERNRYIICKERHGGLRNHVSIRQYKPEDENDLFALIEREGMEWTYWQGEYRTKYKDALAECTVYLVFEGETLCGYVRARNDYGFGVYVMDLLVDKNHRGKEYGRMLMKQVCENFPQDAVYVLGDVYPYYEKLGYGVEGKVYIVQSGK